MGTEIATFPYPFMGKYWEIDVLTRNDERDIINKILAGDKAAYEELVLANQNNVYNLALKLTKNAEDASDISQEVFLKAYLQLENFRQESRFSVWLYRMAYNLCIDFLRKKTKSSTISLTYADEDNEAVAIEIPDLRELPEDVLLTKESRETIYQSIDELGDSHREILIMRQLTAMSYGEIADTLNISEGTVKSRLARARANLVSILLKKGTFPDGYRHKEG